MTDVKEVNLVSYLLSSIYEQNQQDGKLYGGEGGIRTPDSLATMSDFESGVHPIVINYVIAGSKGGALVALVGIVFVRVGVRGCSNGRNLPLLR